MDQTTTAGTTTTQPVDLEALRLKLEEEGKGYYNDSNCEEGQQQLLHTLRTNDCRKIISAVVDEDDLADAFVEASARCHVDILEAFLNHGMKIDVKDKHGWTALIGASYSGDEEFLRFLLDRHASVNIQGNGGHTALMYASSYACKEIVQVLLDHGADCELKDSDGKTALDLAKNEEIKELLRNHVTASYVLK